MGREHVSVEKDAVLTAPVSLFFKILLFNANARTIDANYNNWHRLLLKISSCFKYSLLICICMCRRVEMLIGIFFIHVC